MFGARLQSWDLQTAPGASRFMNEPDVLRFWKLSFFIIHLKQLNLNFVFTRWSGCLSVRTVGNKVDGPLGLAGGLFGIKTAGDFWDWAKQTVYMSWSSIVPASFYFFQHDLFQLSIKFLNQIQKCFFAGVHITFHGKVITPSI